jgi:hypothetical protein
MRQAESLRMDFCLDCHRDPAPRLRPREEVFNMDWTPPPDRRALGESLIARYRIDADGIMHCNVCHR